MRLSVLVGSALLATAFLLAATPSATAAAYCVQKVKEPIPQDRCDGLVCIGYNSQSGWQNCVPPKVYCLQSDCCGSGGLNFYCPDPR